MRLRVRHWGLDLAKNSIAPLIRKVNRSDVRFHHRCPCRMRQDIAERPERIDSWLLDGTLGMRDRWSSQLIPIAWPGTA